MPSTVRKINSWFRSVKKSDLDKLLGEVVFSDRQAKVFEMFYLKRLNIGYIADTLCVSQTVINVELKSIRSKIYAIIQQ